MYDTYIVARYKPAGNFVAMKWQEPYDDARKRIYGKEVQPRKTGGTSNHSVYFGQPALPTQQAHHGQITSNQRYINVDSVGTTLFQRRLTIMCPLGNVLPDQPV